MSGQSLCSWCVEARGKIRGHVPSWIGDWWLPEPQHPEPPASDLKGLAAYDQARDVRPAGWDATVARILAAMPALSDADLDAMLDREDRAAAAGERARDVASLFAVDRSTTAPLTAEHIGRRAAPYPYVHTYLCSPGEYARLVETYRKLGLPLP